MWKSSGQVQVTCWNCRRLNEEASALQVDATKLKVWRASAWARIGWTLITCVIAGATAGLLAFGGTMLMGKDISRICEIAIGTWMVSTSAFILVGTAYCYDHSTAEMRSMRASG